MTWTYKDWYEKNKEKISERRKKKYRDDPEYRMKLKDASKERYWKQKEEELEKTSNERRARRSASNRRIRKRKDRTEED